MKQIIDNIQEKLNDAINEWVIFLSQEKQLSANTYSAYLNDLKSFILFQFKNHAQKVSLEDLQNYDIRDLRSWIAFRKVENFSFRSTARALSGVRNFYRFLSKNYNISNVKITNSKNSIRFNAHIPKAVMQESIVVCIEAIESLSNTTWLKVRDKALLLLIYCTGMRISEALSITKKHLQNDFLRVTGKGKKQRIIPLLPIAVSTIKNYLEILPFVIEDNEPIFRGRRGNILQASVFNRVLISLRRQLMLPEFVSAHAFRHSFATHLYEEGADLRSIQELLGHENLSSTQIYTKVNKKKLLSLYESAHPLERK